MRKCLSASVLKTIALITMFIDHLGMTVVMVSSEMNELMGLCDRILVMYEGEICAEFTRDENGEYSEDEIGRAQAGALS